MAKQTVREKIKIIEYKKGSFSYGWRLRVGGANTKFARDFVFWHCMFIFLKF